MRHQWGNMIEQYDIHVQQVTITAKCGRSRLQEQDYPVADRFSRYEAYSQCRPSVEQYILCYSACDLDCILGSNKGSVVWSGVVMHCGDARTTLDVGSSFAGILFVGREHVESRTHDVLYV